MSVVRKIRLEPFIKIPIQYEEHEISTRGCGEHQDYLGAKFCPRCGKKNISIKSKEKYKLRSYMLLDNDNLCDYFEGDYMYLYSNFYNKNYIDIDENVYTEITPDLIDELILTFTKTHKEDIELLEKIINQKVCVEFGFLNHAY